MPLPRRPLRPGLLRPFRRVPLPRPPGTARLPPAIAGAREHCPSLSNVLARKWGAHTHADLGTRPAPLRGCVLPAPHTTLGHLLCPSSAQLLRPAPSGLTRLPPSFPQVPSLAHSLPSSEARALPEGHGHLPSPSPCPQHPTPRAPPPVSVPEDNSLRKVTHEQSVTKPSEAHRVVEKNPSGSCDNANFT